MYFTDRGQAGRKLAEPLMKYKGRSIVVVAVSPGGVLVGAEIAETLHSNLVLLLTEDINIPGEPDPIGAVASDNSFTYNSLFSLGELEEFNLDYYSYIEQARFSQLHNLHLILGDQGEIKKDRLKHHILILVSDGLNSGFSLDVATNFLKTIEFPKLIAATPFATPEAYDRMRILFDESYCLNLVENFLGVNHYYDENAIPEITKLLTMSQNISLHWQPRHS
jgi:putative phosphoribosyl transferase